MKNPSVKIQKLGEPFLIMSNPDKERGYFGWPTVTRLKNGKIVVGASGYRIAHICPFGKGVLAFSDDEGNTFSKPRAAIDTVLDDRDVGLCAFGNAGLIVTSFNNTLQFQRQHGVHNDACLRYLESVGAEEEHDALGSRFRISHDNGEHFGELLRSPITSPHGPLALRDGRILWVGRLFDANDSFDRNGHFLQVWEILPDGKMRKSCEIEDIFSPEGELLLSCEPHMVEATDGTLVCHIRVQGSGYFTTYQCESHDGGKSFTSPHQILAKKGGAPAHLLAHSSGLLISAYGYRSYPFGIRMMFSFDNGESWQTDEILYEQAVSSDLGYPATVELADGSLLTVFYAHASAEEPAVIWGQKWKPEF